MKKKKGFLREAWTALGQSGAWTVRAWKVSGESLPFTFSGTRGCPRIPWKSECTVLPSYAETEAGES